MSEVAALEDGDWGIYGRQSKGLGEVFIIDEERPMIIEAHAKLMPARFGAI